MSTSTRNPYLANIEMAVEQTGRVFAPWAELPAAGFASPESFAAALRADGYHVEARAMAQTFVVRREA